jgi:hypothetical protein
MGVRSQLAGGADTLRHMQDDTREQFHLLHEAMEMTNKALEELHASLKDAREAKGDVHQTIADAKDNVHQKLADAKAALERAKEDLKKYV